MKFLMKKPIFLAYFASEEIRLYLTFMKKLILLVCGLLIGLSPLQAQDTTESASDTTKCCENLRIGLNGGFGIAVPDYIRLNTRLGNNGLNPIPSEYTICTQNLWVQTGRFRYALEFGQGSSRKDYPSDSLKVSVNHRFVGLQIGYAILHNEKYDLNVFGAVYDHRTRIQYTPVNKFHENLDTYVSGARPSALSLTHNIATARLGASFDYYLSLFASDGGFNLPLIIGVSAHAGVPLTRGSWNYEENAIRDAVYVNPMSWQMSARLGFLLNAK